MEHEQKPSKRRVRKQGGGRKRLLEKDSEVLRLLDTLVEPTSRGDPMSPLRWTCKSTRRLARELTARGHTLNWRGRPLISYEVIVNLIANTTTDAGLEIQAALDPGEYPIGIKVSDEQMAALRLEKHGFHGEWNYTLRAR